MAGNDGSERTTAAGCAARMLWMIVGNAALFFCAVQIARSPRGVLTAADAAFFASLIGVILVRYADIRYLNGTTESGEPATLRDWRRYAVFVCAVGILAWALAHAAAYAA